MLRLRVSPPPPGERSYSSTIYLVREARFAGAADFFGLAFAFAVLAVVFGLTFAFAVAAFAVTAFALDFGLAFAVAAFALALLSQKRPENGRNLWK